MHAAYETVCYNRLQDSVSFIITTINLGIIDNVVTMVTLLLLQSAGVTSANTRSTTAASDVISKDSSLDENDLSLH